MNMSVAGSQSNLAGASALEATVCGGPVLVRPAGGHVGGRTTSPKPAWLRVQGREGVLFIAGVILLWQLVSAVIPFSGHYLFPSPVLTARTLWVSLPELLVGTGYSFLILAPSLALAITLGVIWGMLVGTAPALNRMFSPFARFVSPVPPTIYIPYAIVLLPTFRSAAGFVVFIGVFWPVFLNTCSGAATLPRHYRDNARILGLRRGEYLRRVVFPATLPQIFAGISIGLVFAFIMLTVAEQFGASNGIGRFVQLYADYADYPRMVAGILYTGVVVWISMEVLECIKKRALFWLK
jgi:NitT/TauT family transport system permease protein